jgi:hypothetical protein
MTKKFVVTKVTIGKSGSVSEYLKSGSAAGDLKDLLKEVAKMGNWTVESKGEEGVASAHPTANGHPGHVHGKDYKLYIEKGKKTVDRLVLTKRTYKTSPSKKAPDVINVEIKCSTYVLEDTH